MAQALLSEVFFPQGPGRRIIRYCGSQNVVSIWGWASLEYIRSESPGNVVNHRNFFNIVVIIIKLLMFFIDEISCISQMSQIESSYPLEILFGNTYVM